MKINIEMEHFGSDSEGEPFCSPMVIRDASESGDDMVQIKVSETLFEVDAKELMEALSKFV